MYYKIEKEMVIWGDIEVEYLECFFVFICFYYYEYDCVFCGVVGRVVCVVFFEFFEVCYYDILFEFSIECDGNVIYVLIFLFEDMDEFLFDIEIVC